jgi:glucose-1-phosphate adenylyltransferase
MRANNALALVFTNTSDHMLEGLTGVRSMASVPFGGRYRIIDFHLSNIVNAGISKIGLVPRANYRSLMDHIGSGRPWDLDRKNDGLFVFQHSLLGGDSSLDAKLFAHNMEFINRSNCEYAIVSSSYMIANVDLEAAAKAYEESGADICVI